jgi:hypothetical protein
VNAQRQTAKLAVRQHSFVFLRSRPRNFLRVEIQGRGVVVRAARDNFSPRDKTAFVRYLVAEGFIAERYRRFRADRAELCPRLEWRVDGPSVAPDSKKPFWAAQTNAFMLRALVYGFVLWVIELVTLFLARR